MEQSEFRAVIKYFYLKKWTAAQIKAELDDVHGNSAPALKTIYFWMNDFKRGRTSTKDEPRSGRPVEVTTPQMIEKIHGLIMKDSQMKVREIAGIVGISGDRVHNILRDKLKMQKLGKRWVPQSAAKANKRRSSLYLKNVRLRDTIYIRILH